MGATSLAKKSTPSSEKSHPFCRHTRVCHRSRLEDTPTKKPPVTRRQKRGEPGTCRLPPAPEGPAHERAGPQCCAWSLPAPQDCVGQDTRPEKQRGRRQKDGRATATRNAASLPTGDRRHHSSTLSQCHRRQDQHGQESGHSQRNCPLHCPLHPVLLLSTLSLKWPALVFSSREGTHSVQNRNAKVFIILTIFNRICVKRSPVWSSGPESGGRRIRTFGRSTASGFQDQRIRPLCHAPSYALVAEIIRSWDRTSIVGAGVARMVHNIPDEE